MEEMQINPVSSLTLRKSAAYQNAKIKRVKEAQQNPAYDFPSPRLGTEFPETHFMDLRVIQDNKTIKLATYRYKQIGLEQPKAIVFLFHGLNSSVSHGSHVAKALAEAGLCVVGFDHRGFGASEGIRGFIESKEIHLSDCRLFVNNIEKIYGKEIKKFCAGLSMGGMVSYNLTLESPQLFAGAILMAPAIQNMIGNILLGAVKFIGNVAPRWNVIKLSGGRCHKGPAMTAYMRSDPNTYTDKMCPSTIKMILTASDESNKTFEHYTSPFLVIQGGMDKLVDPDVGFDLMERSPSKDKTHIYFENMWHDIWHEKEINEYLPKIVQWILDRI